MGMALLHRSAAHENESALGTQFLDIPGSAITHACPQPADELIHKRSETPLVWHASLDPFRHELTGRRAPLPISIARPGSHRGNRTHAAIGLESPPLVNDRLP